MGDCVMCNSHTHAAAYSGEMATVLVKFLQSAKPTGEALAVVVVALLTH